MFADHLSQFFIIAHILISHYSEYDRCHSPLGMENFEIGSSQITASSERSVTTPAASGRRNAVKSSGLDGAWCAATNDQVQFQCIAFCIVLVNGKIYL